MKSLRTVFLAAGALLALSSLADGPEDPPPRDPFWPVGYSPAKDEPPSPPPPPPKAEEPPPVAAPEEPQTLPVPDMPEPDWPAALRRLRISGYAEVNGHRSCVINGRTISESEKISIVHDGFRYTWRLDRIAPQKAQMRFTRLTVALLPSSTNPQPKGE